MISHHVTDETLVRYAAGTLPAGLAVVVAAHLETCPACTASARRLEAVGGALLDALPPEPLDERAFNQVLSRLDEAPAERLPQPVPPPQARLPQGMRLPAALKGARVGRWFWVGLGIRYARVQLPWAPDQTTMLLRVAGGRRVLHHSHGGAEFTQVLAGAFTDETGHYQAGDIAEADESWEHQPIADPQGCLCLAALENGLRLPWVSRLLGA